MIGQTCGHHSEHTVVCPIGYSLAALLAGPSALRGYGGGHAARLAVTPRPSREPQRSRASGRRFRRGHGAG